MYSGLAFSQGLPNRSQSSGSSTCRKVKWSRWPLIVTFLEVRDSNSNRWVDWLKNVSSTDVTSSSTAVSTVLVNSSLGNGRVSPKNYFLFLLIGDRSPWNPLPPASGALFCTARSFPELARVDELILSWRKRSLWHWGWRNGQLKKHPWTWLSKEGLFAVLKVFVKIRLQGLRRPFGAERDASCTSLLSPSSSSASSIPSVNTVFVLLWYKAGTIEVARLFQITLPYAA